ncbi:MAG: DUF1992 domain-containing protein [candidate division KSB1 bacterium]|nr:DUF1992 domain-containing protein [candidate division KSB1 bacterium]MDZ7365645.1 DUF1992 domain-containing protein [candidate division KSB1 bacterium]MDZ7403279.1 DUF1992 domain-containing protein [candidate division KSB1 bacterium]
MLAFERLAEEKIRDAIAAGEFDRLPGKGKPLIFDEPIGLRAEDRMAYLVLKNSGFLPDCLLWRKELEMCLSELERFFEHCRQRLGNLLNHLQTLHDETIRTSNEPAPEKRCAWLWPITTLLRRGEQNSARRRGKEVSANGSMARERQALRRTYEGERRDLRSRLSELAHRADGAAQQLHQALVEKEIRDHRPVVILLGSPYVSSAEILLQFDREFPVSPRQKFYEKF